MGTLGPKSTKVDGFRPHFDQTRPGVCQISMISTRVCSMWAPSKNQWWTMVHKCVGGTVVLVTPRCRPRPNRPTHRPTTARPHDRPPTRPTVRPSAPPADRPSARPPVWSTMRPTGRHSVRAAPAAAPRTRSPDRSLHSRRPPPPQKSGLQLRPRGGVAAPRVDRQLPRLSGPRCRRRRLRAGAAAGGDSGLCLRVCSIGSLTEAQDRSRDWALACVAPGWVRARGQLHTRPSAGELGRTNFTRKLTPEVRKRVSPEREFGMRCRRAWRVEEIR